MNSFQRVLLATRAGIKEMPAINYFISTGLFLLVAFFIGMINSNADVSVGVLRNQYLSVDAGTIIAIIVFTGWLSATIICGSVFFKEFKDEALSVRFFSLPLSNTERFVSILLLSQGFVSVISFLPLFLTTSLAWLLAPDFLLLPAPSTLLLALLAGPLVHFASSCYWMFSSIAYPKLSGLFIFGFIGFSVLYFLQTRNMYTDRVDITHTTTAFDATNVVGLMEYEFLVEEATPAQIKYFIGEWNTPFIVLGILCLLVMLATAAMALNRKTT
ncbi:MAG: hypothetical protein ACI81P_001852 [Neolewinella sp.]|jgi:hypothetical protein